MPYHFRGNGKDTLATVPAVLQSNSTHPHGNYRSITASAITMLFSMAELSRHTELTLETCPTN